MSVNKLLSTFFLKTVIHQKWIVWLMWMYVKGLFAYEYEKKPFIVSVIHRKQRKLLKACTLDCWVFAVSNLNYHAGVELLLCRSHELQLLWYGCTLSSEFLYTCAYRWVCVYIVCMVHTIAGIYIYHKRILVANRHFSLLP